MPEPINLILPVNKPIGISTYDVIRLFKRKTGYTGKIGHGGTLDPFASGVVLLLLGNATSRFEEIRTWIKKYLAGIRLGATSTTLDIAGIITDYAGNPGPAFTREDVEQAAAGFIGQFVQKIPAYSAAKHEGVPLYRLARRGVAVAKSKTVSIQSIQVVSFQPPTLACRVTCSGGVYIRQLAQDIGLKLGGGGFLYHLVREQVGDYLLRDCLDVEDFTTSSIPSS